MRLKMTWALLLLSFTLVNLAINAFEVSYDSRAITIDGKRKVLFSGSIHYPRSTAEMWPSLINKAKEGGLDVIETYVFWNAHEPQPRQYDFSGNLDLVKFIKTIQKEGLYAMLRIGPYVCAEWNYGGFPVWLHNMPNMEFRTNNTAYMNEMQTFTTLIVDKMRHENLFASQGGPIILAQIENEYGNIMSEYGENGKQYVQWCAQLAESYKIGVPWVMCQQSDAPDPIINTCNGWYCDQFSPNSKSKPKMWTENWTGWFKNWGGPIPHRTARDVAYAVARFFQYGGTFQNYYMYHGGTNFGRTSGGPYITTSYDYDAPLDEYGNKNQPKWGHLKQLHELLKSMEDVLTQGTTNHTDYGNLLTATVYNYSGKSACFLGNANSSNDATIMFQSTQYIVPAWSVSILPNCVNEVYNTAKINAQTSIMVMKDNKSDNEEEPHSTLNWQWMHEPHVQMKDGQVLGSVSRKAAQLLDQKVVTNDTSDYLWYITSVDISENDPIWSKIRVSTNGHVLHVFVNGAQAGYQYGQNGKYSFTYEAKIKLKKGTNEISLLSGTVGLPNYGAHFSNVSVGVCGPVQLVTLQNNTEVVKDITNNTWNYKVGLHGEIVKLYCPENNKGWNTNGLPTNRVFVWYKTLFKSPKGTDPVVVDLKGLKKGQAWVNGNNIGRYWTRYLADDNGCTATCNYRGPYSSDKCITKCGRPTQRWYHVPRSFLRQDNQNTLVLFEEFGGHPNEVKFATVMVEKICANSYEGNVLELSCREEQVISKIKFASFGVPEGECGSFKKSQCESPNALSILSKSCLGKQSCSVQVSQRMLGPTGCRMPQNQNKLAIEAVCESIAKKY
ncbi:beta-galactosidase 15-like [Glycine soja]|uniref:Beta-galactosidase n=1 Tax=Glycine soja TaxID=3848 RepID=A0A445J086_GLYSO|nr:beta-galactosidase 15-like [Glycine soja]RZB91759.1 Beta-galactosidase [Glycine soja]